MTPEAVARHRSRMILAFATIYLIWGSTYLAIIFAIRSIPPFLMAGARFLVAGAGLYLYARLKGGTRPTWAQWGWAALLGALFFLIGNGLVVYVEQFMASGLTALLIAMVSVWTALLEWIRPGGTRPTSLVLVGILLGFLGVALLVMPGQFGGEHINPLGAGLIIFSSFGWALASVLSRTADLPRNIAQASGMEMLAGGAWLLLASLLTGDWRHFSPATLTTESLLAFLYLLVFGSLVAFTCFAWLLTVTTASKVATAGYVNPMVAVLLGWAILGESLSTRTILASLVIVASVVLIIRGKAAAAAVGTVTATDPPPAPPGDAGESPARHAGPGSAACVDVGQGSRL
ncbi:MAG: EamA family transporter [Gemmatimonadales bacterium]